MAVRERLRENGFGVMATAGVYPAPGPDRVNVGMSTLGRPIWSDKKTADSTDSTAGKKLVQGLRVALEPTGAFTPDELASFDALGDTVSNPQLHQELDNVPRGKSGEFLNKILPKITPKAINAQSIVSGLNIAHTWDNLSPAQKGMSLAGLGIQGHRFPDGSSLETKDIVKAGENYPALKGGQALGMLSGGVNIYPLVKKWPAYTTVSKLAGGSDNATDVATFANQTKIIGAGLNGAEVPDREGNEYNFPGWAFAPQYGPGAVVGSNQAKVPTGYKVVRGSGGDVIAVPEGSFPMALGALQGGVAGTAAGKGGISTSAFNLMQKWSGAPAGSEKGAGRGGSALAAGVARMSKDNPFVFSAAVGSALYKHNKEIPERGDDYLLEMGGVALERLANGRAAKDVDADGKKIAQSIPKGSFPDRLSLLRTAWTTRGISSKADAYQLANQGFSEGRFDELDLVGIHQAVNAVFDPPNAAMLQTLLSGKSRVKETINKLPVQESAPQPRMKPQVMTKEQAIERNKMRAQGAQA